jgi:2-polyprenyl-3-methyl-5-hydroxy-6-metoxy-1,4-benzoquinol methylase
MVHRELHERYFESIFSRSNILSKEEFESATVSYEREYEEFLPKNKNAKVLDLGCGTGHFLYFLQKKGFKNYIGIDISEQQISYCKENISKSVKVFDAFEFLKDNEGLYDVIVANDFLEHILKERVIELLKLIHCSLRTGGKFIMKTPNMSNPFVLDLRYKDFTHEIGFTVSSPFRGRF